MYVVIFGMSSAARPSILRVIVKSFIGLVENQMHMEVICNLLKRSFCPNATHQEVTQ